MLNKKNKLTNADEFSSVFSTKNRLASPHFFLHFKSNEKKEFRLGCIVPKKVEKKAVSRNYMKRVINEIFKAEFPLDLYVDIVLRVKQIFTKEDFTPIKLELNKLFSKIQL